MSRRPQSLPRVSQVWERAQRRKGKWTDLFSRFGGSSLKSQLEMIKRAIVFRCMAIHELLLSSHEKKMITRNMFALFNLELMKITRKNWLCEFNSAFWLSRVEWVFRQFTVSSWTLSMVRLSAFLRDPLKLKQAIAPAVWVQRPLEDSKYLFPFLLRTQWWKDVPLGPPDIILGIFEDFKVDANPNKIDLSVGAYRDNAGKPYVLRSILKAEQRLVDQRQSKSDESDIGSDYFREVTYRLAVGDKLLDRPHVSVQVNISNWNIFVYRWRRGGREKIGKIFSHAITIVYFRA